LASEVLKECGQFLCDIAPKVITAIFDRLKSILHEGQCSK